VGVHFANLFAGLATYQLVGVGLFLPLEVVLPKSRITLRERSSGLLFLFATAIAMSLSGLAVTFLRETFQLRPMIVLHGHLGGPVMASLALALWADFQFYVLHRVEHRYLWRFHAVHHSIRNLSAANSYHHWTEAIWLALSTLPLVFLDVQIGPTLGWLSFIFTYQQFFIHSACRPHLGPLRLLVADNRYHRIHHSLETEHHDKNFGAMTPLWDWLFGTLRMPKSDEWPDVGLSEIAEPRSLIEWSTLPWRYPKDVERETPAPDVTERTSA
jgi:sterol desaturase/sphingolipid hydroxylase (fatty acid hydroxylase superfamily)